jgi:anti-anti-sigma regulatory factor
MTPFSLNLVSSSLQLTLTSEITIQHARELADALKAILRPEHTLEIDASQLTRLDAAGLQVLLSAAQFASETTLAASSKAWVEAFTRYASPDPFRTL